MILSQLHILTLKIKIKSLNLKLVIMWEYQNINRVLQKVTFQISLLWLEKLKDNFLGSYVIEDLNREKIIDIFYEIELQKTN